MIVKKPHRVIIVNATPDTDPEHTITSRNGRPLQVWRTESVETIKAKIADAVGLEVVGPYHKAKAAKAALQRQLESILSYREKQDKYKFMADRPPVAVIATKIEEGQERIAQYDFYWGHDFLKAVCGYRVVGCHYDVPDFTDSTDYGLRVPGAGMVEWYAGCFQYTLIAR